LLKPIRVKRLSDQGFEPIRDLLFQDQLKTGEKLMPERELAEPLGVSRPTVREAINKPATTGFLEQRQGQGTFARSVDSRRGNNPLTAIPQGREASLEDLLEVRTGLENQAAIGRRKRINIERSGATVVATSCPACMIQLTDRLSQAGSRVQAKHVAPIYAETLLD